MTRVLVTGATGLIGAAVVAALRDRGDTVVALSRDAARARAKLGPGVEAVGWADPEATSPPASALVGVDKVINLLGEPIAQRWSGEVKRRIKDSRIAATNNLVEAMRTVAEGERPAVLVSQSGTGYYGPRGGEELTESAAAGSDFLAGVVKGWEAAARAAQDDGIRVVSTRTGVVLAPRGGALAKMIPPFRLGFGGPVGGGHQYLPWIHLDDVVGATLHVLDEATASGPVNLTGPAPVTNREFSKALGRVLHRPAVTPVPAFALNLVFGDMATIVLSGARVVPARLRELDYRFRHPALEPALRDVLAGS